MDILANNSTRLQLKQIAEFFHDDPDMPYQPLPEHSLEQSLCHPIIALDKKGVFYYCKLHPKIQSIYLESIEHHCKYKEPGIHKEIVSKVWLEPNEPTARLVRTFPHHSQQWHDDDDDDYYCYYYYYMT